jgi:hypothetical protein
MADHIHGRINGKLTMILSNLNTKIWFLLLAVVLVVASLLCGCAAEPLTFEQQRAIAAAGAGVQNAGAQIQADARMRQQAALNALYRPLPSINPVGSYSNPVHIAPSYQYQPAVIIPTNGYTY